LASELLKELFFEETGTFEPDTIGKDLMTKAIKGRFGLDYSCRITLNKPIIGIGAPVAAYYPQVAEKFDCELILPKYAEVGNAVGAITGSIVESMDILIRPKPGENAVNDPKCFLFAPFGRMEFETVTEAVDYAEKKASEILLDMVISEGAENPKLEMERIDRKYEFGSGYGADALLETHVKVSAVGKPKQFRPMEKTSYYSDLKQAWDV
jgi:N-methylhydantoinase A/oxoprolinase/acetone carboxylase beta subunit